MGTSWVAMMAAVAVAAPATPATVKDGVDAWQQGNYDRAVAVWRPLAAQGDADAAFNLAQAYKLGRGVPADLAQAKIWYGKAAEAGHEQAAANYGLLLFQDGDRKAAMPWIERASNDGDPRAQYVYGTTLFNGDLAPRDWPRAYALMLRAAASGLPQATTSLAQMDQYISPEDKQAGAALAEKLAAKPMPATSRHAVNGNGPAPASPAPAPAMPSAKPAASPHPTPYGPSARAATATPKLASIGGRWRVQLGAYGSESVARTAWNRLCERSASLRTLEAHYEHSGAIVRLRAGPLASHSAARQACAAAKMAGTPCFAVPPGESEQA